MLQKQDLVGPVKNEEVQASYGVKSWETTRVRHDGPQSSEVLGVHVESLNFLACVQVFEIGFEEVLGVYIIIVFLESETAASVPASLEHLDPWRS
jgi:hypothetical protein